MRTIAFGFIFALLAPEKTFKLEYRFSKGMVSESTTVRKLKLDLLAGGRRAKFDVESVYVLRRTVLELGEDGRPIVERVEMVKSLSTVNEHPEKKAGTTPGASHQKTFVWRLKRRGGRLYTRVGKKDKEVTKTYPQLVQILENWRDARLPPGPVAIGASWDVTAQRFLETVRQQVPENVEGKATFKLESVEEGIASIAVDFRESHHEGPNVWSVKETGHWRFDVAKGRDLEFKMKGKLQVDGGRGGYGSFEMSRTVTYR